VIHSPLSTSGCHLQQHGVILPFLVFSRNQSNYLEPFILPEYHVTDWLFRGYTLDEEYGLSLLPEQTISSRQEAVLTIKAPPSDLVEGEQFQIHTTVFSVKRVHTQVSAEV